ncbi:MAG: N-acetylmuramoyl-L-alanine amidase [bacterium]
MKILLIAGHGAGDPGATGNGYKEHDLTVELTSLIKKELDSKAEVTIRDTSKNAFTDLKNGSFSAKGYDYLFEVHFNAFNGSAFGTEIFVTSSEKTIGVETKVMDELGKYFKVRGVKVTDFDVIAYAKKQGVSSALLETCFIDNKEDITIYQENKVDISKSIAKAIIEGFGLETVETPKEEEKEEVKEEVVGFTHTVKSGESVSTICKTYYGKSTVTEWTLVKDANNLNSKYTVKTGQVLVIPNSDGALSSAYYVAFTCTSIVDGLKSINVDSSFNNRNIIATSNGIKGYMGTNAQNSTLIELAKKGLLKK